MRLRELLVIVVAGFLLVFITPTFEKNSNPGLQRQAQEATAADLIQEENTYKITYKVPSPKEETIADIIWMKKAAEVAHDQGIAYFNVLEQKVYKRYVKKFDEELSVIEGFIKLDSDPMRGEFDANEISSLVLTDKSY